ncbi:ectopic P granules protein 5 homolog [Microplitis demolitor]|uniref:ectopic P granules protein 5 homolog n=1 Tax=Microplitis demolitor TaxID=69319 RepID=UPI0004CCB0D8|nr:ectopic P granules protein 5 homolog [Microplitis demolitor]
MEKTKSRQRRKKDKSRAYNIDRPIPDAPTMEEFECLLGESPTNYPRVEGIANMESELHSAAIDTSIYEKETVSQKEDKEEDDQDPRGSINPASIHESVISIDEVDNTELPEASAPSNDSANDSQESETTFTSSSSAVGKIETDLQETEKNYTSVIDHTFKSLNLNKSHDLNKLQKDLNQLQKDLDQSQKNLNQSKKDLNQTLRPDNNLIAQSSSNHQESSTKSTKSKLQPFTDTQLSSLYTNIELSHLESFINDFIDSQLRANASRHQHRLHELLMSYLRVRNHLILNSLELENLKKTCKEVQKQLWHLDKASITEAGECQDGNPVSASHEYSIAHFNQQALVSLTKNLSSIKDLLHNAQALYCYEAEMLKLQIECYVQRVSLSCRDLVSLAQNASVCLVTNNVQVQSCAPELTELRTCITILFNFQRRVLKDGKFVLDSREWLSKLVAVLLRIATWQDHLFILNHVLRCPGGVTNWAAGFIQTPVAPKSRGISLSSLQDPYLDHMITTLATMLLPIKERDKFLEQVQLSLQDTSNPGDTVWVMLDEEGEEDEDISTAANLFESDLINLLNQIPVDKLFAQVLLIDKTDTGYLQDKKGVTEHHMLRVIAFSTTLIRLFRQGLKTYDSPRYRQLAKRLCALIRDCVQYVSDQWEAFDKNQVFDQSMMDRLQLEYDCFFIRATMCIFSSRRLGAWQYLAAIPYQLISSSALWNIFYCLHKVQDNEVVSQPQVDSLGEWETELNSSLLKQFEEKLIDMPGDESYFLLTTFANMAMARTFRDYDFIRATTIDLFRIGFLSEKTQESCSKDARSLLSNLTNKYPALLSDILIKLRDNFVSVGKLSLYLFTELSIGKWIPKEEDLEILSGWLHNYGLGSTESHLARLILTHLNWGLDRNGDLYLPQHLHYRIAVLIVELMIKYVPETPGQSTSLLESVKNVSAIVRPQNNEQAFSLWAWEMVTRLRLHTTDTTESNCRNAIVNPAEAFFHVPDMDTDPTLEVLVQGVREKQPIACWVSVLMTQWGHSIPLICTKGFTQLSILQCFYKYEQILIALHCVVPLFIECSDSLYKNERFCALVSSLVMADRTYVKMAKNLIAPEFPGPIMRQFGWMIESHMINFKRYCLQNPEPLVQLWLNILVRIPDWNRDNNVMYLMDIVIRAAFFHLDARKTTENIFQALYTNLGTGKSSGSIGSFLNWATGTGSSQSLLGGSTPSIWLAYLILLTEQQERELKTGLWREFLRELSLPSKTSVDSALKRACSSLKITSFGSNSLAIYRWSQQALDTPLDHPLLPLLWQNFFTLFLARVPTASGVVDRGGLGDKFFEGMINLSYLKKLKKRLNETTEYYQVKGERDCDNGHPITDERRVFYFNTAKFYKTLSLWLEEPRLQETGLYLPALPPQYMSQKLIVLMQGDHSPWLEYIDYDRIINEQLTSLNDWQRTCHRVPDESPTRSPAKSPTSAALNSTELDPIQRIYRRLTTYECPESPPLLAKHNVLIENISHESLHSPEKVLRTVQPHLKVILDYATTYNLMVSEHTVADCTFLELIPTLYREVDTRVTLHALCDPAPVGSRRRSGTPPTVHCAGPAVIRIKISEARVSEGIDALISQNRAEYENLLIKACQPPPSKVTQGCVFIDHLIALLEHELNVHRTCENTAVLQDLQATGVQLFYYLVDIYNEEAALCLPTKQLITTCVEKLGQLFISGEESQGPRLLSTIIQRSTLGGLLGPHFTPVAGGAVNFLPMYSTVVDLSTSGNADLCFVLLSKFDVSAWLNYRRPRLSERSTFIELVSKALCNIGLTPEDDKLILHELYRNHLRLVLLHEFPEHYGEVLGAILRGSEGQNLSLDVWRGLLAALSGRSRCVVLHPSKVREEIRRYATEQRLLSRQEIHDTAVLLSKHFMKERLQYGLYGLYPKYRVYNEPLNMFLGMIGHALVVLTLQFDRGSLADQLCERIWPVLSDMFAPWITPYWTRNLREPTAAWIQQLTDDRSVLLPWIITDGPYANKTVAIFVECIRFIIDTMPASCKILGYLWQFYVTNFANASIKDHILNVIHGNFLSLPWDKFLPGLTDVEFMVKVVDQYLPDSHLFLGSIFVMINWTTWINDVLATQPIAVAARMHVCLLNLLVKLSNEPNVRQNEKAVQLVVEAEKFAWHLVDSTVYDQVVNWHVMSSDPRVILSATGSNNQNQVHQVDVAVNNLLKIVAAYDATVTHFHPTTLKKRQIYVRSTVKLLVNCTTRHKSLISTNVKAFTATLSKMLDDMEVIITSTVSENQQAAEAGLLITELLHSVNQSSFLIDQLRVSWCAWLENKTAASPILLGILRVIGMAVTSPATLGEITEAALESYFRHSIADDVEPSWSSVLAILQPVVPRQPPIEGVLVAEGKLLALYAVLMKRLPSCRDIREEGMMLVNLVDWIAAIKPNDVVEEKFPLLWAKAFELAYRQCQYNENTIIAARSLKRLARALLAVADDAGQGWGILGAIGLRKGSQLSIRCKFLARVLSTYCFAQLPDSKSEQQVVRFTPHAPGVAPARSNDLDTIDVRPSPDALKGLQTLESLLANKQYGELKGDIEQAIKIIRDSANSLHNAVNIVGLITTELYNEKYLHVLME